MKRFQKWVLVFGLVLAGHAQAADGEATENYTGAVVDEKGQPVAGATVDCYQYPSPAWFVIRTRQLEFKLHTVTDGQGRVVS